jgi:hypothetical protein
LAARGAATGRALPSEAVNAVGWPGKAGQARRPGSQRARCKTKTKAEDSRKEVKSQSL